jgi:hypothetical protein
MTAAECQWLVAYWRDYPYEDRQHEMADVNLLPNKQGPSRCAPQASRHRRQRERTTPRGALGVQCPLWQRRFLAGHAVALMRDALQG